VGTRQRVVSVGDQEVMSHAISKETVGKSRRGFPTDAKLESQSSHEWYKGSMHGRGIVYKKERKT
jgi:hypothetical protein